MDAERSARLATVAEKSFSGLMFSEITESLPGQALIVRTAMNTREDAAVIDKIDRVGTKRLVVYGL